MDMLYAGAIALMLGVMVAFVLGCDRLKNHSQQRLVEPPVAQHGERP